MQPHQKLKNLLIAIGLCTEPNGTAWYTKARYMLTMASISFVFYATFVLFTITTIRAEDFETAVVTAVDMVSMSYSAYVITMNFFYRHEVNQIFVQVQKNYERCKTVTYYENVRRIFLP